MLQPAFFRACEESGFAKEVLHIWSQKRNLWKKENTCTCKPEFFRGCLYVLLWTFSRVSVVVHACFSQQVVLCRGCALTAWHMKKGCNRSCLLHTEGRTRCKKKNGSQKQMINYRNLSYSRYLNQILLIIIKKRNIQYFYQPSFSIIIYFLSVMLTLLWDNVFSYG